MNGSIVGYFKLPAVIGPQPAVESCGNGPNTRCGSLEAHVFRGRIPFNKLVETSDANNGNGHKFASCKDILNPGRQVHAVAVDEKEERWSKNTILVSIPTSP